MSLFPSNSNMDYSIYRTFGLEESTERPTIQKPKKHPYHCQHKWTCKDYPECPKWHRTALRLVSIALVILVAAVIGLTIWVSQLRICSFSDNHRMEMFVSDNETRACDCMNILPRKPHKDTNSPSESSLSIFFMDIKFPPDGTYGNPRLNLCPNVWVQERGKRYNFFHTFKSWINSQKSCLKMESHLLMIQDKAEMDFIQNNIEDGIYFWIGLNITHPQKTWTWLDGTPLNPELFQVTGKAEDNACAVITKKGVFSEKCHSQGYWICQDVTSSDDDL